MGVKNLWLKAGEVGFHLQHSSQISSEAGAVVENVALLLAVPFSLFLILVKQEQSCRKQTGTTHFSHPCFLSSLLHMAIGAVVLAQGPGMQGQDRMRLDCCLY